MSAASRARSRRNAISSGTRQAQSASDSRNNRARSGGSSPSPSPAGGTSSQLRALSIDLARGAPISGNVSRDTFDASGNRTGGSTSAKGLVLSRPSATLDPSVKAYDGPVPYTGTGNAPAPAWASNPLANSQGDTQGGQYSPGNGQSNASPYFQQLMAALKTTSQERDVQNQQTEQENQLRNLNRGQDQTNANLANQPIAKPFVTGQQASVAQQFGIDRGAVTDRMQTLQAKLANLQSQRQSSIDVARIGLDQGKYQDSQNQQFFQNQNTLAQQQRQQMQYTDQQTQQQLENTRSDSRYADSQTQQQFSNSQDRQRTAISQQNANRLGSGGSDNEDQENLSKEVKGGLAELMKGATWASVWNRLYTQYRTGNGEQDAALGQYLDQTLDKGTWAQGGAFQQFSNRNAPRD